MKKLNAFLPFLFFALKKTAFCADSTITLNCLITKSDNPRMTILVEQNPNKVTKIVSDGSCFKKGEQLCGFTA